MDIFIFSAILLIGLSIYILSPILLPFVLGIIFAYLLAPVVEKLALKIKSRTLATLAPLVIFMGSIFTVLAIGFPYVAEDISLFVKNIPTYAAWLEKALSSGGAIHKLAVEYDIAFDKGAVQNYIYTYSDQIALAALDTIHQAALSAMAIFDALSLLIITPLVTYYLLHDWPKFTKSCKNLLPKDLRVGTVDTIKKLDKALSAFLRGQLSVCLILGLFYGSALALYGLQMGFFIGLLTGILSFIPFIGMVLGLLFATVLAVMQYQVASINPYLVIFAIFAVGQILEGFILTPKFVGKSTGLHPIWVIFAVMAGGELGGFLGMLIALPLATMLTILLPIAIKVWLNKRSQHRKKV
ncbi:MAG: putative PurR-regulated permease PerM [Alphaproteobacteria bacterium]|jgi:predicted PurR-regulated permease PerM